MKFFFSLLFILCGNLYGFSQTVKNNLRNGVIIIHWEEKIILKSKKIKESKVFSDGINGKIELSSKKVKIRDSELKSNKIIIKKNVEEILIIRSSRFLCDDLEIETGSTNPLTLKFRYRNSFLVFEYSNKLEDNNREILLKGSGSNNFEIKQGAKID